MTSTVAWPSHRDHPVIALATYLYAVVCFVLANLLVDNTILIGMIVGVMLMPILLTAPRIN